MHVGVKLSENDKYKVNIRFSSVVLVVYKFTYYCSLKVKQTLKITITTIICHWIRSKKHVNFNINNQKI